MIDRRTVVGLLLAASSPASAHHGFTGRYDASRPIWLRGRVARAAFSPPHPVLAVAIDNAAPLAPPNPPPPELLGAPAMRAEDVGRILEVELPPVQAFYRLGDRVGVGAVIELIALRNCAPPHQLRSQWIRLADGAVVSREGRLSYMVNGCG